MLYLTRKIGESIIINNSIEINVVAISKNNVKLGFDFPHTASVLRKEVHSKIAKENLIASSDSNPNFRDQNSINRNLNK